MFVNLNSPVKLRMIRKTPHLITRCLSGLPRKNSSVCWSFYVAGASLPRRTQVLYVVVDVGTWFVANNLEPTIQLV